MVLKNYIFWGIIAFFAFIPASAFAASLSLEPSSWAFTVGETFNIEVYLNTEGESINALDVALRFPPDKLQMVSPATGNSIIGVWTSQPKFNNQEGVVRLQGGIPGGINVSRGLIATLTFRARGVGEAVIKFDSESKILANDGKGTDILRQTKNGVYSFKLPAPLGPKVSSPSHPNQDSWYQSNAVILNWTSDVGIDGYSYILNDIPIDTPDNISEGTKESASYNGIADGRYFFHIKSLRDGVWGGVTHYAIKIDTTPPAKFPIEIIPSSRTSRAQPVIQFQTSDSGSGFQRFEIKIIPLQDPSAELLFVEASSPYIPPVLKLGSYDVVIRAFDEAGNHFDTTKRLKIVPVALKFMSGEGFEVRSRVIIPWEAVWVLIVITLILLAKLAMQSRKWHADIHDAHTNKKFPQDLQEKIDILKGFKAKYSKYLVIVLIGASLLSRVALAQSEPLGPPIITTFSENISNEEIFYIGGNNEIPNSNAIVYLQNARTLETQNFTVLSDKKGEWFYRHSGFLSPGGYILWAQSSVGDALSPPSPQVNIVVHQTALSIGASRISYELLYLIIAIASFLLMMALLAYSGFHWASGKKKHKAMKREINEAEEALKRSFAVLRRDIHAQLSVMHRIKMSNALSEAEKEKEEQLLRDLEWAEKYAGKELFDIERLETA